MSVARLSFILPALAGDEARSQPVAGVSKILRKRIRVVPIISPLVRCRTRTRNRFLIGIPAMLSGGVGRVEGADSMQIEVAAAWSDVRRTRCRSAIPATMNGFAALRMSGLPLPRVRAEVLESRMRLAC